jgi:putative phosphoesterase
LLPVLAQPMAIPMRAVPSTVSTHAAEEVRLPADTEVDVVVVADTHGHPHPGAHALIERLAPPVILHAGDIGDLSVLGDLRHLAPVLAVRGNIDGHAPSLPDTMTIDFVAGGQHVLRAFLTHIAVYGPKVRAEVARLARAHVADLVICGHSHVPFIGRDQGLVVFNPGSIGPRRFHLPIVFGVLRLGPNGVSMRHVSCETGQTWLP